MLLCTPNATEYCVQAHTAATAASNAAAAVYPSPNLLLIRNGENGYYKEKVERKVNAKQSFLEWDLCVKHTLLNQVMRFVIFM